MAPIVRSQLPLSKHTHHQQQIFSFIPSHKFSIQNKTKKPDMNCNSFTNLPKIIHPKPSNSNSSAKPSPSQPTNAITTTDSTRRKLVTTFLATTSLAAAAQLHQPASAAAAPAQTWGVRSHIFERFFQPDLSPEESVERIRQTAEGLHSIRDMMDAMAWRFILFYIRLKQDYLDKDLKIAMAVVPQGKRKDYVVKANELVENMSQLDKFIRSPKVYESYLYYEKTLDSIDDLVQLLA